MISTGLQPRRAENIIRSDLELLKNSNATNVRTCHYPILAVSMRLCDEIGILVMSGNNLPKTHGGGLATRVPRSDPDWTAGAATACCNMVNSYKNHSCILFLVNLGSRSGNGNAFAEMKKEILKIDKTRPVHYEPDAKLKTKRPVPARCTPCRPR